MAWTDTALPVYLQIATHRLPKDAPELVAMPASPKWPGWRRPQQRQAQFCARVAVVALVFSFAGLAFFVLPLGGSSRKACTAPLSGSSKYCAADTFTIRAKSALAAAMLGVCVGEGGGGNSKAPDPHVPLWAAASTLHSATLVKCFRCVYGPLSAGRE
jgi:hypothetical protein